MDSTELKELLKGTTAFSILSDRELEQFGERFQLVHYTLGQAVVRAGDEANAFYVVYSGRARVIAVNSGRRVLRRRTGDACSLCSPKITGPIRPRLLRCGRLAQQALRVLREGCAHRPLAQTGAKMVRDR